MARLSEEKDQERAYAVQRMSEEKDAQREADIARLSEEKDQERANAVQRMSEETDAQHDADIARLSDEKDCVPKLVWMRKPEEVKVAEYASLYESLFNDWEDHLLVKHFSVEGQVGFRALLFLPRRATCDLFESCHRNGNIKLYVRGAFVEDGCADLIPDWLHFVKGVVDSEDLPLNLSHETLQQDKALQVIQEHLVQKCLEMLAEIAGKHDEYMEFYEHFGECLKLGVQEDSANRPEIADLLRYSSSRSGEERISFKEYIDGMTEGQRDIYYITRIEMAAVSPSPFLEELQRKDIEVLYMVDPMDEYTVQQLDEFDGRTLTSVLHVNIMAQRLQMLDGAQHARLWPNLSEGTRKMLIGRLFLTARNKGSSDVSRRQAVERSDGVEETLGMCSEAMKSESPGLQTVLLQSVESLHVHNVELSGMVGRLQRGVRYLQQQQLELEPRMSFAQRRRQLDTRTEKNREVHELVLQTNHHIAAADTMLAEMMAKVQRCVDGGESNCPMQEEVMVHLNTIRFSNKELVGKKNKLVETLEDIVAQQQLQVDRIVADAEKLRRS